MHKLASKWLFVAERSLRAARRLHEAGYHDDSASRSYYCAYQAATAMLHQIGEVPPTDGGLARESWSHKATPRMIQDNLKQAVRHRDQRTELRKIVSELYRVRIEADYIASRAPLTDADSRLSLRLAARILKVAHEMIGT